MIHFFFVNCTGNQRLLQPKARQPMPYLLDNIQRLVRDLKSEPLPALPGRLAAIVRPKLIRLWEEAAHRSRLGSLLARPYTGKGVVLMFHEIHSNVDAELRTGCGIGQTARIIKAVRAAGRDIVTIDEGLRRLAEPDSRPFALLTFDDGYLDNRDNALPLLEQAEAPMTIFVPTEMITREIYAWWLALREMVKSNDMVDVSAMERRFSCGDFASKAAAIRQITLWVGTDQARAEALAPTFARYRMDIPALVDRYVMSEEQLRDFSRHPLVTVGGHTRSHRFLTGLGEADAHAELQSNKSYLERLLNRPVDHVAYPYGSAGACGEREAALAAEAGYRTGFTTRPGHLFASHLEHRHLLPRIDIGYAPQSASALASRLNGLHRLLSAGFVHPVATLS